MKREILYILLAVVVSITYSSCSVVRHIPDNSYYLQRIDIHTDQSTPKADRITTGDFEKYVRQSPNKRFLGINLYTWIYNLANPEKENKWNNLKRRIGEKPILLDLTKTEQTRKNFKVYMDSRGFFTSQSSFELDTLSKKKRAIVQYNIKQGTPYRIDSVYYTFRDQSLKRLILGDTTNSLIHRGDVFNITTLENERTRITNQLKQDGYYKFSINNIEYIADTLNSNNLVAIEIIVKKHIEGYDNRGREIIGDNEVYRIDKINIFTDYNATTAKMDPRYNSKLDTLVYGGLDIVYNKKTNIKPKVLEQVIPLKPHELYNIDIVNKTYSELIALGYFKTARITFTEIDIPNNSSKLVSFKDAENTLTTTPTVKVSNERYLECNIHCTPSLKQSFKVDLEGSTTSSFYGLKATVGYQNRNIFKGAESFDIDFSTGYEYLKTPSPDVRTRHATEFGVATRLSLPRFMLPFRTSSWKNFSQQKTKFEMSINFQDRSFYRRTLSNVSLSYQWNDNKYSSYTLSPVDINVVDVSYLDENFLATTENEYLIRSYESQFISGLTFNYLYNNQIKNPSRNATIVRFNAETSGNLIEGLSSLFAGERMKDSDNTIFGLKYSQYFRTDLSISRKIMIGEKTALAGRLYGGYALAYGNSTAIPFDRLFYSGGSNSMRGWAPRTLGPGSIKYIKSDYPTQLGDVKLEANIELRFPIWGMIHGATFLDAGNVWFMNSNPEEYSNDAVFYAKDFYKQLGLNTGFGLRLDISFAVLRLDLGLQLHNPNRDINDRWISNLKWDNMALNFGVGYPF